jgi:regulator of protease activity HflC (stomatin/prohibitin superfamily)
MNTTDVNAPAIVVSALMLVAATLIAVFCHGSGWILAYCLPGVLVLLAALAPLSLLVAKQWERAVVLRFGRLRGIRGPGLFLIIPFVDNVAAWIDQAERGKEARIILGSAEREVAKLFLEAADIYGRNPAALQLRAMNIIYETTKERGATILMPSAMVDCMNPGGIMGLAGVAHAGGGVT